MELRGNLLLNSWFTCKKEPLIYVCGERLLPPAGAALKCSSINTKNSPLDICAVNALITSFHRARALTFEVTRMSHCRHVGDKEGEIHAAQIKVTFWRSKASVLKTAVFRIAASYRTAEV